MIEPDVKRCQVEEIEGSFMTLGPRSYIRCDAAPTVIVTENHVQDDGKQGAMSMCARHYEKFLVFGNSNDVTVRSL